MTTPALLQPKRVHERLGSAVSRVLVRSGGIGTLRRLGTIVLAIQLVALIVWNLVRVHRFATTLDFSIYYQAWWLIAHGHLSPYDSPVQYPYWQSHGEFLMWPLGILGLISASPVMLLTVQSVALVAAEWVSFGWLCDVVENSRQEPGDPQSRLGATIAAMGLTILVANPWIYWSDSFDFHFEMIGIVFVVLAGRDIYSDPYKRRIWLWVFLALLCGDVVATFVAAMGLSAVLAGKRWRRTGSAILVVGIAWVGILALMGANRGSNLAHNYAYLAVPAGAAVPAQLDVFGIARGVIQHPGHLLSVLWGRRLDVYALLMPSGLIGILSPWAVIGAALVLIENGIAHNPGFITPSFQDILLFVLVPLGTVHVVIAVSRRYPRLAGALAVIVTINAIGWGVVWIPQTTPRWIRVSPDAASALSSVLRMIPVKDEVIASQGVAGDFAGRQWIYDYLGTSRVPVHTKTVWLVVTPSQGIEQASTSQADALIEELAGPLHASLVVHRSGVWAFRWTPPPGQHSLTIPGSYPTIASWTAVGAAGTLSRSGPEADWRAVANGERGYVVSGDYWAEPPGNYEVTTVLSSTVPVNVEVWNVTANRMLFRRSVPATNGPVAVDGVVDDERAYRTSPVYAGVGPFRILPLSPTPNNRLEIRVWSPGGGIVSVASLELQREGAAGG